MVGDALGAPTEQRSITEIRHLWGGRVEEFYEPPPDSPYAKGRRAAQITDDSSQMILLAEAFISGGGSTTPRAVADLLLEWSDIPEYFPHFAGPSTRRAIEALRNGADPSSLGAVGREATMGTSNGGAMRVAPAGLVHPGDVEGAVEAAAVTCQVSHYTRQGVAGAGAIAAGVAVAMCDGATVLDVVQGAFRGADLGAEIGSSRGRDTAGASVRARMERAVEIAMTSSDLDSAIRGIADSVGTGLHAAEAVPAAIGFFVAGGGDPWWTVVGAANAGDDTDTVACMAGAIAGAYSGFGAVRQDAYRRVVQANNLDLESLADRLVQVSHVLSNATV